MSDGRVVEGKFTAYLAASAPRTHHLNSYIVHREEVVFIWLYVILGQRQDLAQPKKRRDTTEGRNVP